MAVKNRTHAIFQTKDESDLELLEHVLSKYIDENDRDEFFSKVASRLYTDVQEVKYQNRIFK
jgi:hypothetical protein